VTGASGNGRARSPIVQSETVAKLQRLADADRSLALLIGCVIASADSHGVAPLNAVAIAFRDHHLRMVRAEGRDAERESGRLSLDEVRGYLTSSLLPRLAREGVIELPDYELTTPDAPIAIPPTIWEGVRGDRDALTGTFLAVGERPSGQYQAVTADIGHSLLEAQGLVKMYRKRKVVNDVALHLKQGEIVGLLGPNGAGKTTTFYMIVGLIPPLAGRILLDGEDITEMPMYRRARRGVGYLSQEPSVFRKLSVQDNILAILETMPLTTDERHQRLEKLLDELSIKHLRANKAYSLSGGERRRLEITRALVTQPKFMMLDEPFAGVDPIAVHDIQTIVAGLRHRGIGVLISDHNVEQTLDIVDRAYIMFDGQVQVSGTVRELVYDETVAEIYLGPTLTARLRSRFSS
jgi:lipopolysaccharide export system ATP-binding protein